MKAWTDYPFTQLQDEAGKQEHRFAKDHWCMQAAVELRHQHARIAELESQLSAIGAGGVEPLRKPPAAACRAPAAQQVVPPFTPLAQRKLDDLLAQGFRITGYSIERPVVDDWSPKRGFITHGGMVGWWTPHGHRRGREAGRPAVAQPGAGEIR